VRQLLTSDEFIAARLVSGIRPGWFRSAKQGGEKSEGQRIPIAFEGDMGEKHQKDPPLARMHRAEHGDVFCAPGFGGVSEYLSHAH
jgi:hypothetical protein